MGISPPFNGLEKTEIDIAEYMPNNLYYFSIC